MSDTAALHVESTVSCALAADGRFEHYKVSLQFDNPEARLAHGFPIDGQQMEVKEMLKESENTGNPFPEMKS